MNQPGRRAAKRKPRGPPKFILRRCFELATPLRLHKLRDLQSVIIRYRHRQIILHNSPGIRLRERVLGRLVSHKHARATARPELCIHQPLVEPRDLAARMHGDMPLQYLIQPAISSLKPLGRVLSELVNRPPLGRVRAEEDRRRRIGKQLEVGRRVRVCGGRVQRIEDGRDGCFIVR